ncbi:MAG TPA: biotin--[acetyl-CoA-carboxylase] ligase [Chitinophagaceae bacterium]|nr:biotin--[acetyl-CoA-carboxylase] ligase [Chitinophagaceae bacterium]
MPHDLVNSLIGKPFIILDTVDSSNNYAMEQVHAGLASHGHAYFAKDQYAGKGQRGKTWISEPGENIALSIVLNATYPGNQNPFLLSAAIALAGYDFLDDLLKTNVSIKWPNDLYWRDRKTGGILIENIYQGKEWRYAIAGIGINVNQTEFPEGINAVSIREITGEKFDALELASHLCGKIQTRYEQLTKNNKNLISEYNEHLFKKKEAVKLRKGNIVFETTVDHVTSSGELITKDTIERVFEFGEIEWIL